MDDSLKDQMLRARTYNAWQLLKLYWQSSERRSAYLFSLVIIILTITLVGFAVIFNYWFNYFYNALQEYNKTEAIRLLVIFCIIAAFYIITAVYRYYISTLFGLRWRRWLTHQFVNRWLQNRGYYYLENFDEKTDNPDQRIQEDVNAIVNDSINLAIGIITAITTVIGFLYILWQLSGILTIPLGRWGTLHIPGYLVWVSVVYSFAGSLLTFKIGRPLIGLNFEQQRREANFRFAAVDLRKQSENVALYRGEAHQKGILNDLFGKVLSNWYFIILRQKLLLWFTAGYNQLAVILPLIVALPNYFGKVFMLGGLIQTLKAFDQVQDSFSFLINAYTQIAQWRATTQRLTTFVNHLYDIEHRVEKENHLRLAEHSTNSITTNKVFISTPLGEPLLENINEAFVHGNHYLIKGPSGVGKSTFIRTIAGIWPFAAGNITLPEKQQIMYIPQKPYMPIGTLAEAILFPDRHKPELDDQIKTVLRQCRLEKFISRIHEATSWSEQMSPGEQQRVGFARVLLNKPDWVFLDESTSMLDLANETYLYQLVHRQLPNCSIVSVGHRPSLEEFHSHVIDMEKYTPKSTYKEAKDGSA